MEPNAEADRAGENGGDGHPGIADNGAAGKNRNDHGKHSGGGQKDDVDPGMTEEPEQLLPEDWIAAGCDSEKMRAPTAIQFHEHVGGGERRHSED